MHKMEEYCFLPSLDNDDVLAVRVNSGPYSGTVVSMKKVEIKEDSDGPYFNCDLVYEIVVENGKPNPKADIEKLNRDAIDAIVSDVINQAIKSGIHKNGE